MYIARVAFVAVRGGVLAGTVDIGAACAIFRRPIPYILHSIAGGVLGPRSFELGAPAACLGFALQEMMGVLIAGIYFAAIRSPLGHLRHWRWWESGALFGIGVFGVMNYVIVPLSAWHSFPEFTLSRFVENVAAMILFGLIVAYFVHPVARRHDRQSLDQTATQQSRSADSTVRRTQ